MKLDPRDAASRFEFGDNWRSYAETIGPEAVDEAERALLRLVPDWRGKRVLDIGSGSGIHTRAMLNLGASQVVAIDIDPLSVATTEVVTNDPRAVAHCLSVFSARPGELGTFDVVYSWGVLHHTGAMWEAIERAAALVRPGGKLVVALYQRTALCRAWTIEKRLYTAAAAPVRAAARWLFAGAFCLGLIATGRNPAAYVRAYRSRRGMSFWHDIHDWLGGYPYESASSSQVVRQLAALGCRLERHVPVAPRVGIFGAGCAEYVFSVTA